MNSRHERTWSRSSLWAAQRLLSFATSSADSCSFPLSSSPSAFSFLVSASLPADAFSCFLKSQHLHLEIFLAFLLKWKIDVNAKRVQRNLRIKFFDGSPQHSLKLVNLSLECVLQYWRPAFKIIFLCLNRKFVARRHTIEVLSFRSLYPLYIFNSYSFCNAISILLICILVIWILIGYTKRRSNQNKIDSCRLCTATSILLICILIGL